VYPSVDRRAAGSTTATRFVSASDRARLAAATRERCPILFARGRRVVRYSSRVMLRTCGLLVLFAACSSSGGGGGGGSGEPDAASSGPGDGRAADAPGGDALHSTLTSSCAALQGRAIVNENGNLGIAFTEHDSPYTFLGSVSFELPDGFTGTVPDPEHWDGESERHVIAMTTATYETFGNHCWSAGAPSGGSISITDFRPGQGIVEATFTALQLHSCTGSSVCAISGAIETTGEGVFE
jgi:hypothetical protein